MLKLNVETSLCLNRRKLIACAGLALPSLLAVGCSNPLSSNIEPAQFTEQELKPPMDVSRYRPNYKEPVGKFKIHQINDGQRQRDIHVYRPKSRSVKPKSVLVLLHGSNRGGPSLLDKWQVLSERHNILLIAPDSFPKTHWSSKESPAAFFENILKRIPSEFGFDMAPIYGFGHSAGAVMLTLLSIHHGEMFRRIAVHAGNISPEQAEISKKVRKAKTPLGHFIGTNDHIFKVSNARDSARILSSYGQETHLITIQGHNHWYYDLATFINQQAWKFLNEVK